MGKHKTDRTQQLYAAARRYTLAQQANRAIEQHNFDKLIRQGVVVLDRQAEASMLNTEGRGRGRPGGGEL